MRLLLRFILNFVDRLSLFRDFGQQGTRVRLPPSPKSTNSFFNPIITRGGAYLPPPSNNVKFNHVDEHPRPQFFLTIPHFEWGSGCNTVGSKKIHNFARKMKSWSILLHFHKGGPLRTTDPLKKSLFQTMSWGGSRYPKVVNPFVWCQSE